MLSHTAAVYLDMYNTPQFRRVETVTENKIRKDSPVVKEVLDQECVKVEANSLSEEELSAAVVEERCAVVEAKRNWLKEERLGGTDEETSNELVADNQEWQEVEVDKAARRIEDMEQQIDGWSTTQKRSDRVGRDDPRTTKASRTRHLWHHKLSSRQQLTGRREKLGRFLRIRQKRAQHKKDRNRDDRTRYKGRATRCYLDFYCLLNVLNLLLLLCFKVY